MTAETDQLPPVPAELATAQLQLRELRAELADAQQVLADYRDQVRVMLEKTAAELGAGPRLSTYTVPITVTGSVVQTVDETGQDSAVRAALAICGLSEGETYLLSGQRFRVESVTAGRAAWKAAVRFTLPY